MMFKNKIFKNLALLCLVGFAVTACGGGGGGAGTAISTSGVPENGAPKVPAQTPLQLAQSSLSTAQQAYTTTWTVTYPTSSDRIPGYHNYYTQGLSVEQVRQDALSLHGEVISEEVATLYEAYFNLKNAEQALFDAGGDIPDTFNFSTWSNWSPSTASPTEQNIKQTRTRALLNIVVNGVADSPTPVPTTSELTETRTIVNTNYVADLPDTFNFSTWSTWSPATAVSTQEEIEQTRTRTYTVVQQGNLLDNPAPIPAPSLLMETKTVDNPDYESPAEMALSGAQSLANSDQVTATTINTAASTALTAANTNWTNGSYALSGTITSIGTSLTLDYNLPILYSTGTSIEDLTNTLNNNYTYISTNKKNGLINVYTLYYNWQEAIKANTVAQATLADANATIANLSDADFSIGTASTTSPDLSDTISASSTGLTNAEISILNNTVNDIAPSNVLSTISDLQGNWISDEVKTAWSQGWTGKGVDILVVDGFEPDDNSTINLSNGSNNQLISGGTYTLTGTQVLTHGDLVSSVAGGSNTWDQNLTVSSKHGTATYTRSLNNIYGIAAEANVSGWDVFINSAYQTANPNGVPNAALSNYDVINLSIGDSAGNNGSIENPFFKGTFTNTIDSSSGTLLVTSSGNSGHLGLQADDSALTNGLVASDYGDSLLIVGALHGDESGESEEIAFYSNQAGSLRDDFVVDYGCVLNCQTITANSQTGTANSTDGTSFAAPRVAGKAAIIMQKFDSLDASQVADLIKITADDLGAAGVDNVYGHGKVNLTKALSPVGNLN